MQFCKRDDSLVVMRSFFLSQICRISDLISFSAVQYHQTCEALLYIQLFTVILMFVQEAAERERLVSDPKAIMPAAFVSFKTRWGAAVCAQTQQSSNPTLWLTEWAPEPRDVYWSNLAIPFVELTMRRLIMAAAFFFLTFFFMIPIAFVQSLANIQGIEKVVPFLKPLIEK